MEKTKNLIYKHEKEFEHFKYYLNIIDKIEDNIEKMPDISIESCKSLIEGLSKTILVKIDDTYIEKRGRDAEQTSVLFKNALLKLSAYSYIDIDFILRASSFAYKTSEIRNDRGDISHGKASPKKSCSDSQLAQAVMHITDGVVHYVLDIFFNTDWSSTEKIKYEENRDFNEMLDSVNDLGDVSYSRALFDQDEVGYIQQLTDYLSIQEED